ncbi:MAG: branched-chain amino acid ABC transporter permease [Vulcanimicrobiaceae bacterium]
MTKSTTVMLAVAVVVLALVPLVGSGYVLHLGTVVFYYAILAACWNLLAGYVGAFSLAQVAFAGIGAYTTALAVDDAHVPIWAGIGLALIISTALGAALGMLVLRLRTIYLAIATWAFSETFHIMLGAEYGITRGELGLSVPPLFANLEPRAYYYTFLALAIVCIGALAAVVRSPLGQFMRAIKDDELRARSLGVDATWVKVFAFALSSGISGLAGAFYAHYLAVLSPQLVDFNEMGKVIIMVIVGGLGNFVGPLVGAAIVQVASELLRAYGEWDLVVFALIVILIMRSSTGGLAELVARVRAAISLRRKRTASDANG